MDTSDDAFEFVEQTLRSEGSDAAFELLARRLRDEKKYPLLFDARVMKRRRDLGLPLIQTESPGSLPPETQRAYDQGFIEAAREVGNLFLADGDIQRAWPYFRAIGEPAPIAAAIEATQPGEGIEPIIEIAFQEGVNPYKGFELILAHHGICRAISSVDYYPGRNGRDKCIRLLVRTLHRELADNLKRTIAEAEGQAPDTSHIPTLIQDRDWLFGEYSYYVDTSHLCSIIRYSLELDDPDSLGLALELTEYGKHLSQQFHFRGDPPFDDIYEDHAVYIRALLGSDVDQAIAHFRNKVAASNPEETGTLPAEVLVGLLSRLKRYAEAIQVSIEHIPPDSSQLSCPTVYQLCQLAGDFTQLRKVARERGDLVSFTAGAVQAGV